MPLFDPLFTEDDLLPLSGLQHLLFCERQWALIHIERQWAENRLTQEGRVLHERVHESGTTRRTPETTGSLPARGAWIETFCFRPFRFYCLVAPRAGSDEAVK